MKRLREKWNSQRGASLLLALLFLLVCVTAAASVLAAAASNGGKLPGGYTEQQKYLALSSALRLTAGQLQAAEYRGSYEVLRWSVPVCDDEGRQIGETKYYHVQQTAGRFTCGTLGGALDLTRQLDGVCAGSFRGSGYTPLSGEAIAPLPAAFVLTVGAEGSEAVREKFPEITVSVTVRRDLRIRLTAELREAENRVSRMEAELTASGLPVQDFTPGAGEFPGTAGAAASSTLRTPPAEADVTWKLDWIAREVAGS